MRRYLIISLIVLLVAACVDPFEPPVGDYEELLVVEAFISDEDEPQLVKLSLSSPLDTARFRPVTQANVLLNDDQGNMYSFLHDADGNYYSTPGSLEILPGRSYTLVVNLPDGDMYQSEPVSLKQTPPLRDVYFKQETFVSDQDGSPQEGYVIMTDTDSPDGEPLYLRFDWDETFMTVSPFPSNFIYNNATNSIELREDNITECWLNRTSTNVLIATTEGLTDPDIRENPIRYLSFNSEELNHRYSILVKQYALDEDGYEFWKSLRETNETTGTLFDVLPFPLTANISNTTDPEKPVLGYFDLATVSTKRIYIDREDLPAGLSIPTLFQECVGSAGEILVPANGVPALINQGYLISYAVIPGGYVMVPQRCIDCTLYGSNIQPDFWEQ